MSGQFLTLRDVADQLKVSTRTVRRMVSAGLPVVNLVNRVYRIDPADLDRFLASRRKCPRTMIAATDSGASRSRSTDGALARRLGPARKRSSSKPSTAAIYSFPASGSARSGR